jgi:hypothetical protein
MAWPVAAQIKVGEVTSSVNGSISAGYNADFGNMTSSDHSWLLGGVANYTGSFYNPNFLSFNASVFINQSRANSDFQSISDASGVNVGATIFGGSRFPGSISYTKQYNSEGSYAVPGLANYVTHGNNDALGISWGLNLPHAPTFSVGYQMGSSQYSVYGTDDQGSSKYRTLNLHSSYRLAGFSMGAFYVTGEGHALIPEVVSGATGSESQSDNSGYGFNVSHQIPFQGSVSASVNRSEWNDTYAGSSSTGTIDLVSTNAQIHPAEKLSFSASANYSDNLAGQLLQAVVEAGSATPDLDSSEPSDSLDLQAVASYSPLSNLQTSAYAERRTQHFEGESYGVTSYGGSASYSHEMRAGTFNSSLNVTENSADTTGDDTLGISTTENYSTEIQGWHINGSFNYAQNVQTLLVTYMNSFYSFSGNARRRWAKWNVTAGAGLGRTALTQQAGTANSSQSYNSSVGYSSLITATGTYSRASGQALATGSGLVAVPVPSPILPSSLVSLYGGDSYSFGLSSTPAKKLILTAAFSKSKSNTTSDAIASTNQNEQFNALVQYQVRKLNFTSGYSRLEQGFSGSTTPPEVVSSFYIGVSRWFNFF